MIEQYPHCDQRILHKQGTCEVCDEFSDWQELRRAWGIAFTGESPTAEEGKKQLPCPADFNRGEGHQKWGPNRPAPYKVHTLEALREKEEEV